MQGTGFGLIGDVAIGIVGAFIASWLLPRLGIGLGAGVIRAIINSSGNPARSQNVRLSGCPYRKLDPDVLVVQSAENWHRYDAAEWLDGARRRRVLIQR